MLSVIKRACLHPLDYVGIIRTHRLTFQQRIQESEHIYSFIFEPERPFLWQAGQHAIFSFPDKNVQGKTWRPFSIASAPHERVIRVGTNVPPEHSDFKEKLMQLTPGERVHMRGPFGEFHRHKNIGHIIGVAGGIGITPFRSLVTDIAHSREEDIHLTLIYSCVDSYTYKDELEAWATDARINIIYTHTPEEVNAELDKQVAVHRNNAHYFIAGPPGMIGALRGKLRKQDIHNIVNDPFKGY